MRCLSGKHIIGTKSRSFRLGLTKNNRVWAIENCNKGQRTNFKQNRISRILHSQNKFVVQTDEILKAIKEPFEEVFVCKPFVAVFFEKVCFVESVFY